VADDRVMTQRRIDDETVHLYQVVHEAGDFPRDWVVIELDDESITLATLDFDEKRMLDDAEFVDGSFTLLTQGGVPVWGY
jgi:hypothetical protein